MCCCLCTDINDSEREMIATWVRRFKKGLLDSCAVLTGREVFLLCEFFARRSSELRHWRKQYPKREKDCIRTADCLEQFGYNQTAFLKKWVTIYMYEFFGPEESLPELEQIFCFRPTKIQVLLDFFLLHGGCLTNKFICDNAF
jgi:hypothetical protein